MDRELSRFLADIRDHQYSQNFASFHATNLIMQEGVIEYDIKTDDHINSVILDYLIKLDAGKELLDPKVIDDLLSTDTHVTEIEIVFILYRTDIVKLYQKFSENTITVDSLKSAYRKYCKGPADFEKLFSLCKQSVM